MVLTDRLPLGEFSFFAAFAGAVFVGGAAVFDGAGAIASFSSDTM